MPSFYPEGNTPRDTDTRHRVQLKILDAIGTGGGGGAVVGGGGGAVGTVDPEGNVTADPGTSYLNSNTDTFWFKQSGSGNTGWLQLIGILIFLMMCSALFGADLPPPLRNPYSTNQFTNVVVVVPGQSISNALRSARSNTKYVISPGTYFEEMPWATGTELTSTPAWNLQGLRNVTIEGNGAIITNANATAGYMLVISNCYDIRIEGLQFHLRKIAASAVTNISSIVEFRGTNGTNIVFEKIAIRNASSQGICDLDGKLTSGVTIRNSYFHNIGHTNAALSGNTPDGAAISGIGPYWTIEGNEFDFNNRDIEMECSNAPNISRPGVKIRGNRSQRLFGDNAIVIFGNSSSVYSYTDYEISGNTIADGMGGGFVTQVAIKIGEGTRGLISGNIVRNFQYGAYILSSSVSNSFGSLIGNTFIGIRGTGIEFDEHSAAGVGILFGWMVEGNVIGDCGDFGIDIIGARNITVKDNFIYNCSTNAGSNEGAISLRWFSGAQNATTNNVISGNHVADFQSTVSTDAGIKITSGVTNTYIFGNTYYRVTPLSDSGTGTQIIDFNPVGASAGQALVFRNNTWTNESIAGSGDVTAAANFATDNRLIRSDGTGKGVQASGATLDDTGNLSGVETITATNLVLQGGNPSAITMFDADGTHHFRMMPTSATTTNVNLIMPEAPYNGYLKYTLSGSTNLTPEVPFIQDVGAGRILREFVHEVALGDETNAIVTGTALITWRAPYAFTVTAVRSSLSTASSSGLPTVDINEGGTTILSTKLTIDANEKTSTTAATSAVISDTAIADDAEITFDIDTAGTGAKGLKVKIYGYR